MSGIAKIESFLYKHSPPKLQDGLATLYGWRLMKQRFGDEYYRQEAYLRARKIANTDWLAAERDTELARLLNHCRNRSPHYSALLPQRPVHSDEALDVLASLPPLAKEDLRTSIADIRTLDPEDGVVANTGGTTGASLQVVYTKADVEKRFAVLHEFQRRFGVHPRKDRKATFSGRELVPRLLSTGDSPWRDNRAYAQRLYSTFHLHGSYLDRIIDDLEMFAPPIVNGFVSAISLVATGILARGRPLSWSPKVIFTTSETLTPHDRALIEEGFRCKVRDQYGSAEGAPIATECTHGNVHLNTYTGIIDTVEVDGQKQACVTSFTNYGTPLLRYLIGDVLHLAEGQVCACGSAEPIVSKIEGRASDFLYADDGSKVSASHLSDVIKGIPNTVRRVKFLQDRIGSLTMLIEVDQPRFIPAHLEKMKTAARYRFGENTHLITRVVEQIPLTEGGKFRMIECTVDADLRR